MITDKELGISIIIVSLMIAGLSYWDYIQNPSEITRTEEVVNAQPKTVCHLKARNEETRFTTQHITGNYDVPYNKIDILNYYSISPISSNVIVYHHYERDPNLISKNIIFNKAVVLGVSGGEVQCLINCPNRNNAEGCEIGVCPRYNTSCISIEITPPDYFQDPYYFGSVVNNCYEPLTANIYLNYTVIDEVCR